MKQGSGVLDLGIGANTVEAYASLDYAHRLTEDVAAFARATGHYMWKTRTPGFDAVAGLRIRF